MPMIGNCSCKHDIQDKLHGKGRRVLNETQSGSGSQTGTRCTVCGTVKLVNTSNKKGKK